MDIYVVLPLIAVFVFIVVMVYRTPKNTAAAINAAPKTMRLEIDADASAIAQIGFVENEQVALLKGEKVPEIIIKAKGNQLQYRKIAVLQHKMLYNEFIKMRLRGKVLAVKGSIVTMEFSY